MKPDDGRLSIYRGIEMRKIKNSIIALMFIFLIVMCAACSGSSGREDNAQDQMSNASAGLDSENKNEDSGSSVTDTKTDSIGNSSGAEAVTADSKQKDIVILFTSDIHCGVDQGFGLAGVAMVKQQFEKLGKAVILVDNGDAIQGEPLGTMTKGEAITDLMNKTGYDIAIPGNHEFDYGMDRFLELTEKANFPYISCNFNKEGELVFEPYVIKEIGGRKLGFVGVTTPYTLRSSTPRYFMDDEGNFIYGFMQDETGDKLVQSVQSAVDDARAAGAEKVFVMGHMGNISDGGHYNYAEIVSRTDGIDVFLDGHSHDTDKIVMKNKNGEDVTRLACGTKLQGIGWVTISGTDGTMYSGLYEWKNDISAPEFYGYENEMVDAVDLAMNSLNTKLAEIVATTNVTLTINDPYEKDAQGNPIRIIRIAETNLGDLCADAYRDQLGADIGFINGGGIKKSINEGAISLNDILKVHPYGNMLCMVEATGRQILDALEWGARMLPGESGSFLQVSGLTYEINVGIDSHCTQDAEGLFTGVDGEYRVRNVMIGGEPLDPRKTYTVASHNYMLKNCGDGFTMFKDAQLLLDEILIDNQALINYITDTLGGSVGAEYGDPYGQGRIVITE